MNLPIQTRRPPLRASDFEMCLTDPFMYFLRVRCGLTPLLSHSKALSRGSWFHKALESMEEQPEIRSQNYWISINLRLDELKKAAQEMGISSEKQQWISDHTMQDAQCALAYFEATSQISAIPYRGTYLTFPQYFALSHWKLLATELLLWDGESACQLDRLYLDVPQKKLWILDAKTCDCLPVNRLQTCPIEFATPHYLSILNNLLPRVLEHFNLDGDITIGGMMHLAVQKAGIEFCGEDRDFVWEEYTLKKGKRKGQIEMRKNFTSDEPVFSNYVSRVGRWYKGEMEYLDKQAERTENPPVNISFTTFSSALDNNNGRYARYLQRRRLLASYAQCEATTSQQLDTFAQNIQSLREGDKLSAYAPFYLCPVEQWEEIIVRGNFIQSFRNPEIEPSTPPFVGSPNANNLPTAV